MKVMVIPNVIGALGTISNGLVNGLGELGNGRTSRYHPDYSIIRLGQNTEKSHRDLWRLGVTQTTVKGYQLKLARKTFKQ